jgi:putative membrane protein
MKGATPADHLLVAPARRRLRRWSALGVLVLGGLALGGVALAAEPPPITPTVPAPTLEPSDKATLQKLHDENQTQMHMGKIAEEKGSTSAVRDFGRRLANDHAVAERKIDEYLRTRGTEISALATRTSTDPSHELLSTRTGADFDRTFAQQTVQDLQEMLDLLNSERVATVDDNLRLLYDGLIDTVTSDKKAAEDLLVDANRMAHARS